MAYVLLAEGIPVVYQGDEAGFNGGGPPGSVDRRQPLWWGYYDAVNPYYRLIWRVSARARACVCVFVCVCVRLWVLGGVALAGFERHCREAASPGAAKPTAQSAPREPGPAGAPAAPATPPPLCSFPQPIPPRKRRPRSSSTTASKPRCGST